MHVKAVLTAKLTTVIHAYLVQQVATVLNAQLSQQYALQEHIVVEFNVLVINVHQDTTVLKELLLLHRVVQEHLAQPVKTNALSALQDFSV